jgi:hypothetical protein
METGASVYLKPDGKVAYAGATNYPIGVVVTHNNFYKTKQVTVITGFVSEVTVKASAAIAAGDLVSATGFDATDKVSTYAPTGAFVVGIALSSAAANGEVLIGIHKTPFARV